MKIAPTLRNRPYIQLKFNIEKSDRVQGMPDSLGRPGFLQGLIAPQGNKRIQRRIDIPDSFQGLFHHLQGRDLPGSNQP